MTEGSALKIALALVERPAQAKLVRDALLPPGTDLLLAVAAGEPDALAQAQALTMRTEPELRAAAGFFVEQAMLFDGADYYRVLGSAQDAPASQLRRNMALLMRWVHPDVQSGRGPDGMTRTVFARRITQAWDELKSQDRRSHYDEVLDESLRIKRIRMRSGLSGANAHGLSKLQKPKRLRGPGGSSGDLVSRVLQFIRGHK